MPMPVMPIPTLPTAAPLAAEVGVLSGRIDSLQHEVTRNKKALWGAVRHNNKELWEAVRDVSHSVEQNKAYVKAVTRDVARLRGWRPGVPPGTLPPPPFSSECSGRQASCGVCVGAPTSSGGKCV